MSDRIVVSLCVAAACLAAAPAAAQTVPFADTEDATLSEVEVGEGDVHPIVSFDIRNGDFARGAYDDDGVGVGRVPVHVAIGGVAIVHRRADREPALFLIGQSSNGVHAPGRDERASPRAWYESNNLLGLAWRSAGGLTAAATYTVKTSPNGVAPTTHEASLTVLYSDDSTLGRLRPKLAVTKRPKGDGGFYTIAGIAPEIDLTAREDGPTLTLPVTAGVGWRGFYSAGSGDRSYGSVGAAVAQPLRLGAARASLRAEVLALVRDDRLRRLDGPAGTTAAIVPYATLSFTAGW